MATLEKDKNFKRGVEIKRKNKIIYEKSFEYFALENGLSYLLNEFSERNIKNPRDYSLGSSEKVWWICPDCKSEYDTQLFLRTKQKCNCPYCAGRRVNETNSLWTTHPNIAKLLANSQVGHQISAGNSGKELFSCPNCNYEEEKWVQNVVKNGFKCPICSDGYSYPEKFTLNVLNQLSIIVKRQMVFDWSKNIKHENERISGTKKYDFYIPSLDCIIETHGEQHYDAKVNPFADDLMTQKENDKIKEQIAKENKITHYVEIDCRISNLDYIKNSIMNSELAQLINLDSVNWMECHEYAISSLVKKVCDLWGEYTSVVELSERVNIEKSTIRRYLLLGSSIGLCDYNGQEEARKTRQSNLVKINKIRSVKIVQLTVEGTFVKEWDSIADAQRYYKINNITAVCKGKQDTSGGHRWMYKDEYNNLLMDKGEVVFEVKPSVVQLSLDGKLIAEHKSIGNALKAIGKNSKFHGTIRICCTNHNRTAYGYRWMYKEDYIKNENNGIN